MAADRYVRAAAAPLSSSSATEIVDVAAVGGELLVERLQLGRRAARGTRGQGPDLGQARLDGRDGAHQAAPCRLGRRGLPGWRVNRIRVVVLGDGVGGDHLLARRLDAGEGRGEIAGGLDLRHRAIGDDGNVDGDVTVQGARVGGECRHHDHHDSAAECDLRPDRHRRTVPRERVPHALSAHPSEI